MREELLQIDRTELLKKCTGDEKVRMTLKVLVAATDYPNLAGSASLMYIHARHREYVKSGISVTVLSFRAKESYVIDGIQAVPLKRYFSSRENYDILICHVANLRNHSRFLLRFGDRFPQIIFLVIGKGNFFSHYDKANNIIWQNTHSNHGQIIQTLQTARCALMPTRTDAQGVMACEMASIWMPVITSDIPVCHVIFEGFKNVTLIPNECTSLDLAGLLKDLEQGLPYRINTRYCNRNTSMEEIKLIQSITATAEMADSTLETDPGRVSEGFADPEYVVVVCIPCCDSVRAGGMQG